MGTSKEDLQAAVDKLVADVMAQNQAAADKAKADGDVMNALQAQSTAAAAATSAQTLVQADVNVLVDIAAKFSDGDETT